MVWFLARRQTFLFYVSLGILLTGSSDTQQGKTWTYGPIPGGIGTVGISGLLNKTAWGLCLVEENGFSNLLKIIE